MFQWNYVSEELSYKEPRFFISVLANTQEEAERKVERLTILNMVLKSIVEPYYPAEQIKDVVKTMLEEIKKENK